MDKEKVESCKPIAMKPSLQGTKCRNNLKKNGIASGVYPEQGDFSPVSGGGLRLVLSEILQLLCSLRMIGSEGII